MTLNQFLTMCTEFVDLQDMEFYEPLHDDDLVRIDDYVLNADIHPTNETIDDNCYWPNLTFFMMRAPITQSVVFIGKNYRDVELEQHINKGLFYLLNIPWINKPSMSMQYDANGGMTVAFYCVRRTNKRPLKNGALKVPFNVIFDKVAQNNTSYWVRAG